MMLVKINVPSNDIKTAETLVDRPWLYSWKSDWTQLSLSGVGSVDKVFHIIKPQMEKALSPNEV